MSSEAHAWDPKPLLFALGLCAKAGRLVRGVPMVCEALGGRQKPVIVLSAEDNAKNSAKKLADKCAFYGVPLVILPLSGEELSRTVGKTGHTAALAVADEQLAVLVKKNLPAQ
ncbi:MAG: ribosomal L7Ae/L30e/S12e/Gadd45 family protein [Clostridia bacterium]|nr:ribosomal L7Ae/L30e/S12e/Gadd45 family protein [Clostridia bacterium]